MSDLQSELIPELRTSRRFAIVLTIASLAAIGVAVFGVDHVEDALGSESAALAVLGTWCLAGCAGAIAGIVDAYVRPAGETIGLAASIAATTFAVLAMVVLASMALGAMDLVV